MAQWTVYPSIERPKLIHARMSEDQVVSVTVDMNSEVSGLGTSVSSAAWTTESGNVGITSEALASNVATAQFTAPDQEIALVKVALTLADSQIVNQFWKITIRDPIVNSSIWGVP